MIVWRRPSLSLSRWCATRDVFLWSLFSVRSAISQRSLSSSSSVRFGREFLRCVAVCLLLNTICSASSRHKIIRSAARTHSRKEPYIGADRNRFPSRRGRFVICAREADAQMTREDGVSECNMLRPELVYHLSPSRNPFSAAALLHEVGGKTVSAAAATFPARATFDSARPAR